MRSAERMGEVAGGLLQGDSGPAQPLEIPGFVAFGGHRCRGPPSNSSRLPSEVLKNSCATSGNWCLIHDHGIGPGQSSANPSSRKVRSASKR